MKNVSSLVIFFLFSNFAFGQIEWVGNHIFSESATDIVRTSQNQYILAHNGLTVLDSMGAIVHSSQAMAYISEISELPDSSILLAHSDFQCDIVEGYIRKYDKNWNEVWSTPYPFGQPRASARLADGSVLIATGFSSILKVSENGDIIWVKYLGDFEIMDISTTASGQVLLAAGWALLTMTPDGEVIDTNSNIQLDYIEKLPNGNFLTKYNDVLFVYTPDFVQLASYAQTGYAAWDFAISQNEINMLTLAPSIVQFDLDLIPLDTLPLTGHNQIFHALAISNGGYTLAGSELYGSNINGGNYSTFIKEFAQDGSTASTAEDIALSLVTQSGPIEVINYFDIYAITIPNIFVTVLNLGATTVESLNINFRHSDVPGFPCPIGQSFSKSFDNLNLQPAMSVELAWGELELASWGDDLSGELLELCFWTSLPNHHLETNNDNDVSCTEVMVTAHEPLPISFHHAFNAVADELYIDLPTDMDYTTVKAHIFNAAGQLMHTKGITDLRETLQLHDLMDGVYFLQIVSGERVGWGKFAKY
jgi:hypothetical protein